MRIAEDVVGAKQTDVSTGPAVTGERQANGDDANGLTEHGLNELLNALQAMRVGDFTVRMAGDRVGLIGKIGDTFNDIVATNQRMAQQLERVGQVVGREGRTRQRVRLGRNGVERQFADRRFVMANDGSDARRCRSGARRSPADRAA